jgi:glycerol-3-phosphate cytidylyltransferase-like family protein
MIISPMTLNKICEVTHRLNKKIYIIASEFNPVNKTDLNCINHATLVKDKNSIIIAIAYDDFYLNTLNKSLALSFEQRIDIVNSIKGIDYVTSFNSKNIFLCEILRNIKPNIIFFCDNHDINYKSCKLLGTTIFK